MKKMKRYISYAFSVMLLLTSFGYFSLVPVAALSIHAAPGIVADAASCTPGGNQSNCAACHGLGQLGDTSCQQQGAKNSPGQDQIAAIAKDVVNIISLIAGMAAVIMIVYAGVKFVTSGGESNAVSSAKNALVYAIIGLVLVALAQLIVHFVLGAVNGSVSSQ